MNPPAKKIAVTGGAGQIAYALLFRLAAGELLGPQQPVALHLLEIPPALPMLGGVKMELDDGAFPLLSDIRITDEAEVAFGDADFVFMVGAKPRGPGMERGDLLEANAGIFSAQGRALNNAAKKSVKILVVGNPANTNCLIARHNAPDIADAQFSAMTRLDHNRARAMLARKCDAAVSDVRGVSIWGNHSATQFPDIHHATVGGKSAIDSVGEEWYCVEMIPAVQQRGAAVIKARGASSAASAANAALEHMRDWTLGGGDDWTSMAVISHGEYETEPGLVYSYPTRCKNGDWEIVRGLAINDFSREKMRESESELIGERDAVRHLLP